MKKLGLLFMWIVLLVLLGSCLNQESYQIYETWLCSINADGTGFRKIKKSPFNTPGLVNIYMTKDNKIIFYGDRLWISDTDVIAPVSITDNIYTLQSRPARLSQSPDGSKLFFAADKNIYKLSYPDYQVTQLTNQSTRWLRNPIVSDLGNYITFSSNGFGYPTKETEYMYWLNLITGQSGIIPSPDSVSVNPCYSEVENYVYYEEAGLFRSRLDGSDRSVVDTQGGHDYPYTMFSISQDLNYITHNYNTLSSYYLRVYDTRTSTGTNILVKMGYGTYQYLGVMCKSANIIYYVRPGYPEELHAYYLDSGDDIIVLQTTSNLSISEFINIAPTWDGSKVYFTASVEY